MRDRPPQRNHPTSFYTMLKKNSNKVSSARFPIFCLNAQDDVSGELHSFYSGLKVVRQTDPTAKTDDTHTYQPTR